MAQSNFMTLAAKPSTVRRALGFSIVVGTILILINHGDALLAGDIDTRRTLKILLTYSVPYCVSTLSSVQAVMESQPPPES